MSRALNISPSRNVNPTGSSTPGETNTMSNVGGGGGTIFKQKTGVDFELKTFLATASATITNNTNDISIAAVSQLGKTGSWINFNGSSLAINGSSNVSSVTSPATGNYKVTFTAPLAAANYAVAGSANKSGSDFGRVQLGLGDPNISLMLHGNGTNASTTITDDGYYKLVPVAYGDAQISTGTKKYGTGSLKFDGTGDYIVVPDSTGLHFGAGDFCIEFWLYLNSFPGSQNFFVIQNSGGTEEIQLRMIGSTSFQVNMNNSAFSMSGNPGISLSTWTHVAVVRYGSTAYLYIDGVQKASASAVTITTTAYECRVGGQTYSGGLAPVDGFMDDFRITKGSAVYTGAFTPPAAEFTSGSTKLTTHCFIETSVNNTLTNLTNVSAAFIDT